MIEQKYIVSCINYYGKKTYNYYGIILAKETEEGLEILKEYNSLTSNKSKVLQLVDLCNKLEISIYSIDDVVEDFLYGENELG